MKIIELPKINDPRGNLTFIQNNDQIPFKIERVYWIYNVPGGNSRVGTAFKKSKEFIVAITGSIEVEINFSKEVKTYTLSRPNKGLYIPNLTWRNLKSFSTNAVAMVVSSNKFDSKDYIRDYTRFKKLVI